MTKSSKDFQELAQQKRATLVQEFWYFLKTNKKWWLLPILVVLFGVGVWLRRIARKKRIQAMFLES